MTPTEQDKELEVALMELFCRSEEFGRTFLTCASKEEFAEAVNGGALDHQQAAHEAMQLITQYGDTRERLGEANGAMQHAMAMAVFNDNEVLKNYGKKQFERLVKEKAELKEEA